MNDLSVGSTLVELVLPDVDVSFPLGSSDREPIHAVEDSEAGVAWTAEAVVCLCRIMESMETMEDVLEVLETTGEKFKAVAFPRDCVSSHTTSSVSPA